MARKTQTPPKNFEEALRELEQILSEIENGQVGLEESLVKYERGNFLITHCRGVLNAAERQVEILSRSADGGLTATPVNPAAGETAPPFDVTDDRAGE
ncbi:MAG TPA: exodeoxyribonuclease VII small subunit [Tepidisphaeraceae bacterium]|nr:exodeoxyribonuclease VII small subunit [Tepidisphaeraceae bacterium]